MRSADRPFVRKVAFNTPKSVAHHVRIVLVWLLVTCSLVVAISCGGSGAGTVENSRLGRMAVKVQWPDASRLVPFKTKSLKIVIDWVEGGKATLVDTKVVDRPDPLKTTVTETVFNLKSGTRYRLTVTAHPNPGGTGTALARHVSAANLAIKPGVENQWPVTMTSTVHTLSIEPTITSIGVGEKQVVSVVAKDASGATVLLALSAIRWTVGAPAVLKAEPNVQGLADNQVQLEGLVQGSSSLTVTDDESGKTSPAMQIAVEASAPLTITPKSIQVDAWSYTQFMASGGTGPYSWSHSGGLQIDQTGKMLTTRLKGSGTVTVRDTKNQSAVANFQVISTVLDIGTLNQNGVVEALITISGGSVKHLSAQHYIITVPAGRHTLSIANSTALPMQYQIGGPSSIRLVNSWEESGFIAPGAQKLLLVDSS